MAQKISSFFIIIKMNNKDIRLDEDDLSIISDHIFEKYVKDNYFVGEYA